MQKNPATLPPEVPAGGTRRSAFDEMFVEAGPSPGRYHDETAAGQAADAVGQGQSQGSVSPGQSDGGVREAYAGIAAWLARTSPEERRLKAREAEVLFRRIGITFAVYTEGGDPERLIPFDIIPRILDQKAWQLLERGLTQRVKALNAFLLDTYNGGEIVKAGHIPSSLILGNESFRPEMQGFTPPASAYTHISGIDIVRTGETEFHVLEDNCRTPSGVSYMLENREAMLRLFPGLVAAHSIASISRYPDELLETLRDAAPPACRNTPNIVLLTPGQYNSAYYEHSFLADEMGIELVEGADLFVDGGLVFMRTTEGPRRVDVIYRRLDDDFLDPLTFRHDSTLGVPGLFAAYRAGAVTLANAVGTGIADDKGIYPFVPEMIRFYLGEEPILANVPTWRCAEKDDLAYVLEHLGELVVKETRGSGGYGMLVGPTSTKEQCAEFAAKLRTTPADYIAQPTLALSTCPTFVESGIAPRHVDLRPFVLYGKTVRIVPGGLTRVAIREGSLVVNSSQGGGTKDTWVLEDTVLEDTVLEDEGGADAMLARTADSLFWLARYMERAENVARTLQVGHRMASLSRSIGNPGNEWWSTLVATGCSEGFSEKYGTEEPSSRDAVHYLVRDADNPSSIFSCFETARRNARAVRTALTVDMWEALNETWLGARSFDDKDFESERVVVFLDWVKHRSLLFHGAYANTMLRNDAYYFTQLGTFVERADNTARILDVKYHVLLPAADEVGGALDYYQWRAILRAVSALRSYHWVYHDRLHPWHVAELLILRPEMPRSLRSCYAQITRYLDLIAEHYAGKRGECHRLAGEIDAKLRFGRIQGIFQGGLHEFLTEFIDDTETLGRNIAEFYLVP